MTETHTKPGGAKVQHFIVDENASGQRVDNFLLSHLKGVPKTRIYRGIRKGEVRVNGKRIKPEHKLACQDEVRIPPLRTAQSSRPKASPALKDLLRQSVLYQDDSLLVVNKPSGIPVHAGTGVKISIIDAWRDIFEGDYLELVHRLDKGTSGCLLLAKNAATLKKLQAGFRSHAFTKTYHALVHGKWPAELREVNTGLQRMPARQGERKVTVDSSGKSALTHFHLMKSFGNFSLVEARPQTGRTHQIRVHASHAGYPVCGDDKYSSRAQLKLLKTLGITRLCLHAASLEFQHPLTGQLVKVKAPYDEAFQQAMAAVSGSNIKNVE